MDFFCKLFSLKSACIIVASMNWLLFFLFSAGTGVGVDNRRYPPPWPHDGGVWKYGCIIASMNFTPKFRFFIRGGLKSKSSIYIEKIFPCVFWHKKLINQFTFSTYSPIYWYIPIIILIIIWNITYYNEENTLQKTIPWTFKRN